MTSVLCPGGLLSALLGLLTSADPACGRVARSSQCAQVLSSRVCERMHKAQCSPLSYSLPDFGGPRRTWHLVR